MTVSTGNQRDDRNRDLIAKFRAGGRRLGDLPLLLLTTTGARSGRPHTTPLVYVRDGGRLLVLASNYGAPRHPDWYRNVLARPEVHVEAAGDQFDATAVVLDELERDRLLPTIVQHYPRLPDLEKQARRTIPVVALIPA
jgi:deazaflavin-dependent oxidoreductase (nitroreductase family)